MLSKPVHSAEQQRRLACVAVLKSGQCACGHAKQTGMAFCYPCWQRLPQNIRQALYRKIGQGFAAAYDVAVQFLQPMDKEELNGKRSA